MIKRVTVKYPSGNYFPSHVIETLEELAEFESGVSVPHLEGSNPYEQARKYLRNGISVQVDDRGLVTQLETVEVFEGLKLTNSNEDFLEQFKDFVTTYDRQEEWEKYGQDALILDMVYGIGHAMNDKYRMAAGFATFCDDLTDFLAKKKKRERNFLTLQRRCVIVEHEQYQTGSLELI